MRSVKDVVPEEGTMVSISRKVQEWTASDEIEQSNSQPRSQQTEMQEMKQSIEHLTRLVEALSQNRALPENSAQLNIPPEENTPGDGMIEVVSFQPNPLGSDSDREAKGEITVV